MPAVSEQKRIAEVLSALDDKIAANRALVSAAEAWAILAVRARLPRVALRDLAWMEKRQINPSGLGESEVDLYSLPAYDSGALPSVESAASVKSSKFLIEDDAILLSKLNPHFPRIWRVFPGEERPALASTEFIVLRSQQISLGLLWACLADPEFSRELGSRVAGTSGSHQRVNPLDALAVSVSDPRQLTPALAEAIETALTLATRARFENRTLAATRDALLPQLMSGKLRVRDAEAIAADAGV